MLRQQSNLSSLAGSSGTTGTAGFPLQPQSSLRMRLTSGSDGFGPLPSPLQVPPHNAQAALSTNTCSTPDSDPLSAFQMGSPSQLESGSTYSSGPLPQGYAAGLTVSHPHLYQPSPLHASSTNNASGPAAALRPNSPGLSALAKRTSGSIVVGAPLEGVTAVGSGRTSSHHMSRRSSQQQLGLSMLRTTGSVSINETVDEGGASPHAVAVKPSDANQPPWTSPHL